jgi:copper chaperone NosL
MLRRKRTKSALRSAVLFLALGALLLPLQAGTGQSKRPSAKDKCPVCGMFVAEYRDFIAEIVFKDGFRAYFDGPKDMFRFYFEPDKYLPGRKLGDIVAVYVTDYYSLETIDAVQAFFVLGSDVRGPMGNELVPIKKESDAQTFLKDHKGKSVLRFKQVTLELVNGLD